MAFASAPLLPAHFARAAPLPTFAKAALERLGVEVAPSALERDHNAGKSTQVPTGRMIAIKGRVNRKIGYGGAYVSYEPAAEEGTH